MTLPALALRLRHLRLFYIRTVAVTKLTATGAFPRIRTTTAALPRRNSTALSPSIPIRSTVAMRTRTLFRPEITIGSLGVRGSAQGEETSTSL